MVYRILVTALWLCGRLALPASSHRLPKPRDKNNRAVCGRWRHRRAGARHCAKSQQQMGSARRGGKSAGRLGRDRHPRRDEGAARRLYLADGLDRRADGGVRRALTARSTLTRCLAPIAIGAAPPYLLVVNPKLPVSSTADLIRLAKERPEGIDVPALPASAPRRICLPCCSAATPVSNCCTFPTRALVRRSPICLARAST